MRARAAFVNLAGVFVICLNAAAAKSAPCEMIDGELHVEAGQECPMPAGVSTVPIELSHWTMGNSRVIF